MPGDKKKPGRLGGGNLPKGAGLALGAAAATTSVATSEAVAANGMSCLSRPFDVGAITDGAAGSDGIMLRARRPTPKGVLHRYLSRWRASTSFDR